MHAGAAAWPVCGHGPKPWLNVHGLRKLQGAADRVSCGFFQYICHNCHRTFNNKQNKKKNMTNEQSNLNTAEAQDVRQRSEYLNQVTNFAQFMCKEHIEESD